MAEAKHPVSEEIDDETEKDYRAVRADEFDRMPPVNEWADSEKSKTDERPRQQ